LFLKLILHPPERWVPPALDLDPAIGTGFIGAHWFRRAEAIGSVRSPELCNPAGLLPKFDVAAVYEGFCLLLGGLVVGAHQLDASYDVAIRPDKVCSIFLHGGTSTAISSVKLKQMIIPVSV
jgi:hypothetical protein